jgi:hypothetical protein
MPNCPQCTHNVSTPSIFNREAWSRLACGDCGARLEVKTPRSLAFAPLVASLPVLGTQGHAFAWVAIVLMLTVNAVILLDFAHPQLRLRLRLSKPETGLVLSSSGD